MGNVGFNVFGGVDILGLCWIDFDDSFFFFYRWYNFKDCAHLGLSPTSIPLALKLLSFPTCPRPWLSQTYGDRERVYSPEEKLPWWIMPKLMKHHFAALSHSLNSTVLTLSPRFPFPGGLLTQQTGLPVSHTKFFELSPAVCAVLLQIHRIKVSLLVRPTTELIEMLSHGLTLLCINYTAHTHTEEWGKHRKKYIADVHGMVVSVLLLSLCLH